MAEPYMSIDNPNSSSDITQIRLSIVKSSLSQVPLLTDKEVGVNKSTPNLKGISSHLKSSKQNHDSQHGRRVVGSKLAKVTKAQEDDQGIIGSLGLSTENRCDSDRTLKEGDDDDDPVISDEDPFYTGMQKPTQ